MNLHISKTHKIVNQSNSFTISNSRINDPESNSQNTETTDIRLKKLFEKGFGSNMVNSEGGIDDIWRIRWKKIIKLTGQQYFLPQGNIGRHIVDHLTQEITELAHDLPKQGKSERIFIFCACILQKDSLINSNSDIRHLLQRRLDMWRDGQFDNLIDEAVRCNKRFLKSKKEKMNLETNHRLFNRFMLNGKIRQATRMVTERSNGGILNTNSIINGKTVFELLQEKHPQQITPNDNDFDCPTELPSMINVDITASHIEIVSRRISGGAGPSGTNAEQWKAMLLRYGSHSLKLRNSIALLTRKISNEIVEWDTIRALVAKRGIALDKCPGIRPIGIGEVLQRIIAKAMVITTGVDVQEACGADQLCNGVKCGIEAAVHAMTQCFQNDKYEGLLLIDAKNAFNTLNRPLALWNARLLWPRCARFLFNNYRGYPTIVIKDNKEYILSKEGTTQGDPLAMLFYAIGILPLVKKCKDNSKYIQNWYADDSACIGELNNIKSWLETLMNEGPKFGYYPEPTKSFLVVKESSRKKAEYLFKHLNINIVTSHRFLGGIIGNEDEKNEYIKSKIDDWTDCIKKISKAAEKYPQSAYASFTKSLQCEWSYLQRVTNITPETYTPIREAILTHLIPAILGRESSHSEQELFSLPPRLGGLALKNPLEEAKSNYYTSINANNILINAILTGCELNNSNHEDHVRYVISEQKKVKNVANRMNSLNIINEMPEKAQKSLQRILTTKSSQWLTIVPSIINNTDLSATQFRDALAMRYGREPENLPRVCDGCDGAEFNITHALNCKKGGLVKRGHDQHRDDIKGWAELAWGKATIEPIMQESTLNQQALIADIMIDNVWEPVKRAFFDVRIVNADAASYESHKSWSSISQMHSKEKHRKYNLAAEDLRASFTPLIISCDGVIAKEYESFVKQTATKLCEKWHKPYSVIIAWLKTKIQISLIRAVSIRLRGTRKFIKWIGCEDGAGIFC